MDENGKTPGEPDDESSVVLPTVVLSLLLAIAATMVFGLSRC